jgi:hypothetical protein
MYQRSSASQLNMRCLVKGKRGIAELSSFFWSGCDQRTATHKQCPLIQFACGAGS